LKKEEEKVIFHFLLFIYIKSKKNRLFVGAASLEGAGQEKEESCSL
jgi:hypothetical protein